jgi:hypothetical protein
MALTHRQYWTTLFSLALFQSLDVSTAFAIRASVPQTRTDPVVGRLHSSVGLDDVGDYDFSFYSTSPNTAVSATAAAAALPSLLDLPLHTADTGLLRAAYAVELSLGRVAMLLAVVMAATEIVTGESLLHFFLLWKR